MCAMLALVQMSARRELKADKDMQLRLDLEEEQRAEADYEEMLKKEAERMSVRDYQPKVGVHLSRDVTCI